MITSWEVPGGFTNVGLAYDTKEHVIWCGGDGGRVHKLGKDGTLIKTLSLGVSMLQGVAYDSKNNSIWVGLSHTDTSVKNVKQFSKDGKLISEFRFGDKLGAGLAYNWDNDTLFISTYTPIRTVYEITKTGQIVNTITVDEGFGNVKDGLYYADGIAYDYDKTLWITQNGYISIFNINQQGNILRTLDNPSGYEAEGIAVDPIDNTLWYGADEEFHQGVPQGNRIWNLPKSVTPIVLGVVRKAKLVQNINGEIRPVYCTINDNGKIRKTNVFISL